MPGIGRVVLALLLGLLGGCGAVVPVIEDVGSPVVNGPPYAVDADSAALHRSLYVADLHADTLLLSRDMRVASERGHVDLPRLRQARVGLQVFPAVTNMSPCTRLEYCSREPNLVAGFVALQGWPPETWTSDKARVLFQARKLRDVAADGSAGLVLLETREQLAALLREPAAARRIGAILGVEGAQAVGHHLAGVDELGDAGVRILGLAHYFDNRVAGSAHGLRQPGLSAFGRDVVTRALARGMIIDLAHASDEAMADFLRWFPNVPFMVSHTGVDGDGCTAHRNLSVQQAARIIEAKGLIGIGVWDEVLCLTKQDDAATYAGAVARMIKRTVAIGNGIWPGRGHEFLALGSDFDGWVRVGFEVRGWPLVTQALRREGLSDDQIRDVMGRNVCRLLLRGLPGADPAPSPALCD